jgi:hypothetical protein
MGYSGARGTLIYEKNLKAKISCQTPFKDLDKRSQNMMEDAHTPAKNSKKRGHILILFL